MQVLLDLYGYCDRDTEKRNDCYWGKNVKGKENGCLKVGWKGRNCPHWHPLKGEQLDAIRKAHNAQDATGQL